jgi:hypothetical protein
MSPLHVVIDGSKNWLEYGPPWITAITSCITVVGVIVIAWVQMRANRSIERLKSELQIQLVRFSKLHEKRAEIIAEVYRMSVDVEREGEIYIHQFGKGPKNEEGEALAVGTLRNFDIFVKQRRVFLPERAYESLVRFSTLLRPHIAHASAYGDIDNPPTETLVEGHEGFKRAFEAFRTTIPEARRELDREFRSILGVS